MSGRLDDVVVDRHQDQVGRIDGHVLTPRARPRPRRAADRSMPDQLTPTSGISGDRVGSAIVPDPSTSDTPPDTLLGGIRVLDLCGEPAASAGRILADLGAEVLRVLPIGDDGVQPVRTLGGHDSWRALAWTAGHGLRLRRRPPGPSTWPGPTSCSTPPAGRAPTSSIPSHRPRRGVGRRSPRSGGPGPGPEWRASDLGRARRQRQPLVHRRPRPPAGAVHRAGRLRPHRPRGGARRASPRSPADGRSSVDLSMQETVLIADMGGPGRFAREGDRGRRRGANIGRTREIWPCADGWVSFGIRGGKARVATWATRHRAGRGRRHRRRAARSGRDWATFNHNNADLERARGHRRGRRAVVRAPHHDRAVRLGLRAQPDPRPHQLAARDPGQRAARAHAASSRRWVRSTASPRRSSRCAPPIGWSDPSGHRWQPRPGRVAVSLTRPSRRRRTAAPTIGRALRPHRPGRAPAGRAWAGTTILEFGSGAAGPIATRYFAEHGATVIRVESASRPDFLRAYALGPENPHGLDGAPMFDALNPGKLERHPRPEAPRRAATSPCA